MVSPGPDWGSSSAVQRKPLYTWEVERYLEGGERRYKLVFNFEHLITTSTGVFTCFVSQQHSARIYSYFWVALAPLMPAFVCMCTPDRWFHWLSTECKDKKWGRQKWLTTMWCMMYHDYRHALTSLHMGVIRKMNTQQYFISSPKLTLKQLLKYAVHETFTSLSSIYCIYL